MVSLRGVLSLVGWAASYVWTMLELCSGRAADRTASGIMCRSGFAASRRSPCLRSLRFRDRFACICPFRALSRRLRTPKETAHSPCRPPAATVASGGLNLSLAHPAHPMRREEAEGDASCHLHATRMPRRIPRGSLVTDVAGNTSQVLPGGVCARERRMPSWVCAIRECVVGQRVVVGTWRLGWALGLSRLYSWECLVYIRRVQLWRFDGGMYAWEGLIADCAATRMSRVGGRMLHISHSLPAQQTCARWKDGQAGWVVRQTQGGGWKIWRVGSHPRDASLRTSHEGHFSAHARNQPQTGARGESVSSHDSSRPLVSWRTCNSRTREGALCPPGLNLERCTRLYGLPDWRISHIAQATTDP